MTQVAADIFRAYDIRGIVDQDLTQATVTLIGKALGTENLARGETCLIVARDGRLSGPDLLQALIDGVLSTGCDVINIGQVPTPVLYFATNKLACSSGVMLTGSHNPANYNGLKMVLQGKTLASDDIQALYQRIQAQQFVTGEGQLQQQNIQQDYLDAIASDIHCEKPLKVVVDAGNGVAGEIGPAVLRAIGCEVVELYCEIDGRFPNHHPDPSQPENIIELQQKVLAEQADFGIAFDGDGDRLGVVTDQGTVIWPDRQLMLFAQDVLSRQAAATILFDVKCTRFLPDVIAKSGGKPLMWKTGHSLVKAKMHETGAQLAGEMSGHIFFKERWYGFDDGIYSAARLCEILSKQDRSCEQIFAEFPDSVNTPELKVAVTEANKFSIMQQLAEQGEFQDCSLSTIDGIRADYQDGWGLVRPSNTSPYLVMRFEADNEAALKRIQQHFQIQLHAIDDQLEMPY